jgi:acyl-CoA thioesterase-1
VLVLGDSLSAAYGSHVAGMGALTAARMSKTNPGWRVMNASISGETTAAARHASRRIEARSPQGRRHRLARTTACAACPLAQTGEPRPDDPRAKQSGARVLLVGMRMPPNYGRDYTQGFEANNGPREAESVALVPFLLEPSPRPRQLPGRQPAPRGQRPAKIRDHVWKGFPVAEVGLLPAWRRLSRTHD